MNNYMQVLPFNEERQREIYKKCSKKQLIEFLITRDKINVSNSERLLTVVDRQIKTRTFITGEKRFNFR